MLFRKKGEKVASHVHQSFNQSNGQPFNQSSNQSNNQSPNQSTEQPFNQSSNQSLNQSSNNMGVRIVWCKKGGGRIVWVHPSYQLNGRKRPRAHPVEHAGGVVHDAVVVGCCRRCGATRQSILRNALWTEKNIEKTSLPSKTRHYIQKKLRKLEEKIQKTEKKIYFFEINLEKLRKIKKN